MSEDTWGEWSKHVLAELERLNTCYEKLDDKMTDLNLNFRTFQTEMKVKSGMWGVVGGAIPIAIMLAAYIVKGIAQS